MFLYFPLFWKHRAEDNLKQKKGYAWWKANKYLFPLLKKGTVALIKGVNIPMVISSITNQKGKTLSELSESVRNSGKDSICIVNEQVKRRL